MEQEQVINDYASRPFMTSELIELRINQRRLLLQIPEDLVRLNRSTTEPLSESQIPQAYQGRVEFFIRCTIEELLENSSDVFKNWLLQLGGKTEALAVASQIMTFAKTQEISDFIAKLHDTIHKRAAIVIESPDEQSLLLDLVPLLDFADWLASDEFYDPRLVTPVT